MLIRFPLACSGAIRFLCRGSFSLLFESLVMFVDEALQQVDGENREW